MKVWTDELVTMRGKPGGVFLYVSLGNMHLPYSKWKANLIY